MVFADLTQNDLVSAILGPFGALVLLLVALFVINKGAWVPRATHDAQMKVQADGYERAIWGKDERIKELKESRDKYEQIAFDATRELRRSVEVANSAVSQSTGIPLPSPPATQAGG